MKGTRKENIKMYTIDLAEVSRIFVVNNKSSDSTSVVVLDASVGGAYDMKAFTYIGDKNDGSCLCKQCSCQIDNGDVEGKYHIYTVYDDDFDYEGTVSGDGISGDQLEETMLDAKTIDDYPCVIDFLLNCGYGDGTTVAMKARKSALCPQCAAHPDSYSLTIRYTNADVYELLSSCRDNGYTAIFIMPDKGEEVIMVSEDEVYVKKLQ